MAPITLKEAAVNRTNLVSLNSSKLNDGLATVALEIVPVGGWVSGAAAVLAVLGFE